MLFAFTFTLYSLGLGFLIGCLAAGYLFLINSTIDLLWKQLPHVWHLPAFYPLLWGLLGGILVGIAQKYVGPYPKTMHETLAEYKKTGQVSYHQQLLPNFLVSIIVLAFGASLGPEAALSAILGGLITWAGTQIKFLALHKDDFLELGFGALLAALLKAPFVGVASHYEEEIATTPPKLTSSHKKALYFLTSCVGIGGFSLVNHLLPEEKIFGLRFHAWHWDYRAIWLLIPALILGLVFGYFTLYSEKLITKIITSLSLPTVVKTLGAGMLIGVLGMKSQMFLFSGEFEIMPLSIHYKSYTWLSLSLLAVGKILLTHICFACGWRGGKIFPIIFSSSAWGMALVTIFPYMPEIIVAIVIAASMTTITRRPIAVAAILVLLIPVSFFPFVLVACFATNIICRQLAQQVSI